MDNRERLEQIKAREKAATEGPLRAEYRAIEDCEEDWQEGWWIGDEGASWIAVWGDKAEADANFYAHAHSDIPWLVARLEEAEAKLAAVECYAEGLGRGHSRGSWQGLTKAAILAILHPKGTPDA